ncbi:MAG: hypothetical protein C4527_27220 [Candidatus Omnitrophota bacterium]|jgi:hypothetical protein|nr:MAG: hypothetical protein C4527_27220 [Candidatus Omnitrophota bacterium]
MKTKTFDCIKMKREGASYIYEQIKDLSREEKIAYWMSRNRIFRSEQDQLVKNISNDELTMPKENRS